MKKFISIILVTILMLTISSIANAEYYPSPEIKPVPDLVKVSENNITVTAISINNIKDKLGEDIFNEVALAIKNSNKFAEGVDKNQAILKVFYLKADNPEAKEFDITLELGIELDGNDLYSVLMWDTTNKEWIKIEHTATEKEVTFKYAGDGLYAFTVKLPEPTVG